MSDEACGLCVDVWMSILVEALPRLGRAIASIGALEPDYLTFLRKDSDRPLHPREHAHSTRERNHLTDPAAVLSREHKEPISYCAPALA
jgi:hypothetical protein